MRSQCGNKFESHKYKTCWPFIWARIYVRQHSFLKSSIQGCFSLYFFLCMCYVMLCCVCIQLTCALLFNQVCDFLKKIHENCLNTVTAASVIAHLSMFHLSDHTFSEIVCHWNEINMHSNLVLFMFWCVDQCQLVTSYYVFATILWTWTLWLLE